MHGMVLHHDPHLAASGVTGREAEVLAAIGRRLANPEIAERLSITVRTVESHVAQLRRKLGASDRATLRRVAIAAAGRAALPRATTPLVGRDIDLARVRDRLAEARVVTVVGPAGAGKTRLAREVGATWPHDVRLVDLATHHDDDLPAVLASGLGLVSEPGVDLAAQVRVALADRDLLLLLDDAEGVAAALARLLATLVPAVPGLGVLATSRRPLGAAGEQVVRLDPLPLPADDTVAAVSASPAARLFVDRAAAAGGRPVPIDDHTVGDVADACRAVDGLPLGLELAAAATRTLGLAGVAAALRDDRAATSARLDDQQAPGQRSLSAALARSWDLLGPGEQALLGRLAALPDGLTVDRLVQVPAVDATPVVDVPTSLGRLVDASLVTRDDPGGSHALLATVRGWALRQVHPDDVATVRAGFARATLRRIAPAGGPAWCRRPGRPTSRPDHEVAALHHAAATDRDLATDLLRAVGQRHELDPTPVVLDGVRVVVEDHALPQRWSATALVWGGVLLNYVDLSLLRRCVAAADDVAIDDRERAVVSWGRAWARGYDGDEEGASAAAGVARDHFATAGDDFMAAHCDWAAGMARHDPDVAAEALADAVVGFLAAGAPWHANGVRLALARRAVRAGHAPDTVAATLATCRRYADDHGLVHDQAHAVLAEADLVGHDDAVRARRLAAEAGDALRAVGDLRCLRRALGLQAELAVAPDQAVALARRAVAVALLQHDRPGQSSALRRLARLAAGVDDVLAARALGAAAAVQDRPPPTGDRPAHLALAVREGHAAGPALVVDEASDPGHGQTGAGGTVGWTTP